MDLVLLQKQHNLLPFQFLLAKLSLVRMALFFKNHKKTLIFKGNFVRQISYVTLIPLLSRTRYRDFTVKVPFLFKGHKIEALPACNLTFAMRATRLCHSCNWFKTALLSC